MLSRDAWLVRGWSSRRGLSGEVTGSAAQDGLRDGHQQEHRQQQGDGGAAQALAQAAEHQFDIPGFQHGAPVQVKAETAGHVDRFPDHQHQRVEARWSGVPASANPAWRRLISVCQLQSSSTCCGSSR